MQYQIRSSRWEFLFKINKRAWTYVWYTRARLIWNSNYCLLKNISFHLDLYIMYYIIKTFSCRSAKVMPGKVRHLLKMKWQIFFMIKIIFVYMLNMLSRLFLFVCLFQRHHWHNSVHLQTLIMPIVQWVCLLVTAPLVVIICQLA